MHFVSIALHRSHPRWSSHLLLCPLKRTLSTGDETKDKKLSTIESFDYWLEAWSAHEKIYLTNPARYAELAPYHGIIQKANWKFRWKAVYDFDVQFGMSLSSKTKRLDQIDSTPRLKIMDSKYFLARKNPNSGQSNNEYYFFFCQEYRITLAIDRFYYIDVHIFDS